MHSKTSLIAFAGLALVACSPSPDPLPEAGGLAASHAAVTTADTPPPMLKAAQPVGNQYIVVFRDDVMGVESVASEQASAVGGQVGATFHSALHGYVLMADEASAQQLLTDPRVKYVEEDGIVSASATQANATWGLDRIDQRQLPLNQSYTYNVNGAGVHVYVIDTGIRITHSEFGGRASYAYSSISDGYGANDCNGHGTHVAGTVGGTTYGVAKGVTLHSVRVLDCYGSGTVSSVVAGMDWVTANRVLPAVANMSLGGGTSQAIDDSLASSVQAGVVYAVAAGNNTDNACFYSPARAPAALTVAATSSDDYRAYFSNYGACVDLFAPGYYVTSAWNSSDTAINTISGTSMASPHVAGAAALYLGAHPAATPADVEAALEGFATANVVTDPGNGTPNLLAYTGFIGSGNDQTPPTTAITAPAGGSQVGGTVNVQVDATDASGIAKIMVYVDDVAVGTDTTAPYSISWNTTAAENGAHVLKARAFDNAGNVGTSAAVSVTVNNPGRASYDPTLQVPRCSSASSYCDSTTLLDGRAGLGPEPHAPNNIYSLCADGLYGYYHSYPSLDRIRVSSVDGTTLAVGKQAKVEVTVYVDSPSYEALDLYSASDATNPSWTLLATLTPQNYGVQVLTKTFTLPSGSVQAVRGHFRYGYSGSPSTCSTGSYDESDDLVFSVQYPPTSSFTSSCSGLSCAFTDGSSDPDGTVAGWSWSFGDGSTSSEQNPSHAYAVDGTYTVTLAVTDNQGNTGTSSRAVAVAGLPPIAAFTTWCEGMSCWFTDASIDPDGTMASWSWAFGDGYGATLRDPVHTFAAPGTYEVSLTVTDSQGKTNTQSQTVTLIGLTASTDKSKGDRLVNLAWSGATGSSVDVYRNGVMLVTTANDGSHQDVADHGGTYNYRVCMSRTNTCSAVASVTVK